MLLYRGPREHLAACVQYLKDGLAADAAILVAATRQHLESLSAELSLGGRDMLLCDLTSQGADPGRVLSLIRMFARQHGSRPVRCVQDVGWLGRTKEYLVEAIRYESLLSAALSGLPADILCGYDAGLDSDSLTVAERSHPVLLDGTEWRANPTFADHTMADELGSETLGSEALSAPPRDASALTFRGDQVEVRRFAAAEARGSGLPADRITDLLIAVSELAANTLVHTSSTGTLTIWTTDQEIVCQVSDSGQIADPLAGTICPDPSAMSSRRGLWLVHQVSDLVQVRTGSSGTTVRVHMQLPGGLGAPGPQADRNGLKSKSRRPEPRQGVAP